MGQIASDVTVGLATFDDVSLGEEEPKLRRILKELADVSDATNIVSRWEEKVVSKRTKVPLTRWGLGSFAVKTLEKWGRISLMFACSVYLVELSQEIKLDAPGSSNQENLNENVILADSYLNLTRANLILSQFKKADDYCNKSLKKISSVRGSSSTAARLSGYCYLHKGESSFGLSNFKEALENFEKSLSLAQTRNEKRLECLACCAMTKLYLQLKDNEKAIFFSLKASEILQAHGKDWESHLSITVQLRLAEAYRKTEKLNEAMDTAEDAMRSAIEEHDRLLQGYGMLCFADIHRARSDSDRAIPRYDAAAGIMTEVGDQYGRCLAGLGKAKTYFSAKDIAKSLSEYESTLRIAEFIQNKMICLRVYGEMTFIYQSMANKELATTCSQRYHELMYSMNLICGVCGQPVGEKHGQIEALPCFHLFHLRCVSDKGLQNLGQLACPSCRCKDSKTTNC